MVILKWVDSALIFFSSFSSWFRIAKESLFAIGQAIIMRNLSQTIRNFAVKILGVFGAIFILIGMCELLFCRDEYKISGLTFSLVGFVIVVSCFYFGILLMNKRENER